MRTFELPLVDATTELSEAAAAATGSDVSGIVVRHGQEYRLLHIDDLRRAFDANKIFVGDADSFTPLGMSDANTPNMSQDQVDKAGFRFFFLSEEKDNASLLSASELYSGPYLSAPKV